MHETDTEQAYQLFVSSLSITRSKGDKPGGAMNWFQPRRSILRH
ncbi:hypothetical protein [Rhodoflexus sp.]